MKNYKNAFFYVFITGGFTAIMIWIISQGKNLEINKTLAIYETSNNHWNDFLNALNINLHHSLAILLAQIVTIIIVARIFGWIFRKIGQPSVIGEIIAGIALGPSLLKLYFPEFSEALFPVASLSNLQFSFCAKPALPAFII